jgi:hypothetical protein
MKHTAFLTGIALFVAGLLLASPASAHRYHTSLTEADYNREEQSLQVSLRTFADDLENILSRRAGKRINLDRKKEAEPLLLAYLQDVFQLKGAAGESLKLSWVGMEAKVDSVWIYFETKIPGGIKGLQLSNRFLQDLFDDQLNVVNIKEGNQKIALTFARGDSFKPVEFRARN